MEKQKTLAIDEATHKALKIQAATDGHSIEEATKEAIDMYLAVKQKGRHEKPD